MTEERFSYDELMKFLDDNKSTHKQVFIKFPATGDAVRLGITRVDDTFKDHLREIKKAHAHSNIEV